MEKNHALFVAIDNNDLAATIAAVRSGANVNSERMDAETPLMAASEAGWMPIVRYLLECPVRIDQRDGFGLTALSHAVLNDRREIALLLISRGADPNNRAADRGTSLIDAASWNLIDMAKILLDHGAKIDPQDDRGNTALIFAVRHRYHNVIALLLNRGASLSLRNKEGNPAMDIARSLRDAASMKLLRQYGAK